MIQFDQDVCTDLSIATRKEWLETNGLGGFASSTIAGLNTRRYHGLLTAALHPPAGRAVLLSKLEETLYIGSRAVSLSANHYPHVIHPDGHLRLREFRLDPFPTFTYVVEGVEIVKRVFLVHGEDTVVVEYELPPASARPENLRLDVRPLIAFRDYHSLTSANSALNPHVEVSEGQAVVAPYQGMPALRFAHDAKAVDPVGVWFYSFEYDVERERGLDFQEDLFSPMTLSFDLRERTSATLMATLSPHRAEDAMILRESERTRRRLVADRAGSAGEFERQLATAADQFLVRRGDLTSVIAGYPWFADWGRDTMIALPGLTLALGLRSEAREILLAFAKHVDQGMLPNRFPDAGEAPEYNTVDATLWFFEAVAALLDSDAEHDFVRANLYPALCAVIDWHVKGTRYGIRLDADGLLISGEPGVQLTWMDAKVGDWVVTPRHGKPVEIQALWYNALRILEDLADRYGDRERRDQCSALGKLAKQTFNNVFWNQEYNCLFDVIDSGHPDSSIRPNQIFAVSLRHPILDERRAAGVVQAVEKELLTPLGLRTLAPGDPSFRPRYEGGVSSRDGAYHQGTVWPWLLGPFVSAYLRVNGRREAAIAAAEAMLQPLQQHLLDAGLGQISEIFDATAPHEPRGCPAQAWSISETIRALQLLRRARQPELDPALTAEAFPVACFGA